MDAPPVTALSGDSAAIPLADWLQAALPSSISQEFVAEFRLLGQGRQHPGRAYAVRATAGESPRPEHEWYALIHLISIVFLESQAAFASVWREDGPALTNVLEQLWDQWGLDRSNSSHPATLCSPYGTVERRVAALLRQALREGGRRLRMSLDLDTEADLMHILLLGLYESPSASVFEADLPGELFARAAERVATATSSLGDRSGALTLLESSVVSLPRRSAAVDMRVGAALEPILREQGLHRMADLPLSARVALRAESAAPVRTAPAPAARADGGARMWPTILTLTVFALGLYALFS